jgi:hypothetical protein
MKYSCRRRWMILINGGLTQVGSIQQSQPMTIFFWVPLWFSLMKEYETWKTWAPPKCKLFMWLDAHKRCWTSDNLAQRGLPHPEHCPLCDQEDETLDHLLVSCVFTRQFWYMVLRQVGLHSLAPQPTELIFDEWWEKGKHGNL